MERLKITAISLLITIMTFELGPLVLSALLYYAYTCCENRPEKSSEVKKVSSLYVYIYILSPFLIFYFFEFFWDKSYLFEILRYIFSFKVFEVYSFYGVRFSDKLVLFSVSHLMSIFAVFFTVFRIVEHKDERYIGLIYPGKKLTVGASFFIRFVMFFVLSLMVFVYYVVWPDLDFSNEDYFFKGGILNVIFFPVYIYTGAIFFAAKGNLTIE